MFEDAQSFWAKEAINRLTWITPPKKVCSGDFHTGHIRWFEDGMINVSVNCLDRHLPKRANQAAILWEGDEEHEQRTLTFAELHQEVCRMANVLKGMGVQKGDVVAIYLPMIPEAAIAMLACARIGAVHTVIFAGFSPHALSSRIKASHAKALITADSFRRGGKTVSLKQQADEAISGFDIKTLIIAHEHIPVSFNSNQEYWWHEYRLQVSTDCPPEPMNAEDPLFILYTSGSTGQPKGLLHTTAGYLLQSAYTHDLIFKCSSHDIFWCTADVGWITGHSYVVYGPLCNGITTLMYGGVPNWPDAARCWRMVDKYHVSVFYTAPTAIRSLMRAGDEWLTTSNRQSLRMLGSVGEPINPEVWRWYLEKVGMNKTDMVDTWWQTETGAIMISPQCSKDEAKPGAAMKPVYPIRPVLLNQHDKEITGAGNGLLAIAEPWPSMARTIVGDHERFVKTYFRHGYYITGDGARRDKDGDFYITGRVDDVLNVSGHRLGTAEIENALVKHPSVAEAAVVGIAHELKGQGICAYVVLKRGAMVSNDLPLSLKQLVCDDISPIARPDDIRIVSDLPKTRSGKIMRRILRKIACGEVHHIDDLGDLSTLANPDVVQGLMQKIEA